jgi:hypothetical protein
MSLSLARASEQIGGVLDDLRNGFHALEIAVGTGGKPGFNHVDLQALQLAGNPQLLIPGHGGAGRLLAVAQGGVENDEFVGHGGSWRAGALYFEVA